jgi:hypothetical protein
LIWRGRFTGGTGRSRLVVGCVRCDLHQVEIGLVDFEIFLLGVRRDVDADLASFSSCGISRNRSEFDPKRGECPKRVWLCWPWSTEDWWASGTVMPTQIDQPVLRIGHSDVAWEFSRGIITYHENFSFMLTRIVLYRRHGICWGGSTKPPTWLWRHCACCCFMARRAQCAAVPLTSWVVGTWWVIVKMMRGVFPEWRIKCRR